MTTRERAKTSMRRRTVRAAASRTRSTQAYASVKKMALCAMAALLATPPAFATPPLPPPEPPPPPEYCREIGYSQDPYYEDAYGRGAVGGSMRQMAPSSAPMAPPPPPPPAMSAPPGANRVEGLVVTGGRPYLPPMGIPDRDRYPNDPVNAIKRTAEEPVSTFSIDVDTASYANVRRFLNDGQLPPSDAVRVEELINYFDYRYERPHESDAPFRNTFAVVPSPWSRDRHIVHIGLQGYDIDRQARAPLNLVFLIDTSGSMQGEDRLALAKRALTILIGELQPQDHVAMVAYAGSAGAVLPPTQGSDKRRMHCALGALRSGGSTAGGEGLALAYALAEQNFRKGAVNRVILLTDGDFNVGISDPKKLEDFVAQKRKSGVYLSVYGFGRGNYNDVMMQTLAQSGNGTAAYIDTIDEGRKVFRDDFAKSLFPIADDVKIQVEFNPAVVAEYRLIGYETRMLNREDFNNDRVDAGEVGAGASVTALYEVALTGAPPSSDPLRYQRPGAAARTPGLRPEVAAEFGHVKVRYKLPGQSQSLLISQPITYQHVRTGQTAPESTRWAMAVAAYGQKLRGDGWLEDWFGWNEVEQLANSARSEDPYGLKSEFVELVRKAGSARNLNE